MAEAPCFFQTICEESVAAVGLIEGAVQQLFIGVDTDPPDQRASIVGQYEEVVEGAFGRAHLGSVCLTLPGQKPCNDACPIAVAMAERQAPPLENN